MARKKLTVDVDIRGIDKFKTIIELMDKHKDEIPSELSEAVAECLDCDVFEWNSESIAYAFGVGNDVNVIVDGESGRKGVTSVNLHLKRLTVYTTFHGDERPKIDDSGESIATCYVYPESLLVTDSAGNHLLGW